jgi:hypothetical protein
VSVSAYGARSGRRRSTQHVPPEVAAAGWLAGAPKRLVPPVVAAGAPKREPPPKEGVDDAAGAPNIEGAAAAPPNEGVDAATRNGEADV